MQRLRWSDGEADQAEAHYAMGRADADANPFDGDTKYKLTLETPPPVDAFWSVMKSPEG